MVFFRIGPADAEVGHRRHGVGGVGAEPPQCLGSVLSDLLVVGHADDAHQGSRGTTGIQLLKNGDEGTKNGLVVAVDHSGQRSLDERRLAGDLDQGGLDRGMDGPVLQCVEQSVHDPRIYRGVAAPSQRLRRPGCELSCPDRRGRSRARGRHALLARPYPARMLPSRAFGRWNRSGLPPPRFEFPLLQAQTLAKPGQPSIESAGFRRAGARASPGAASWAAGPIWARVRMAHPRSSSSVSSSNPVNCWTAAAASEPITSSDATAEAQQSRSSFARRSTPAGTSCLAIQSSAGCTVAGGSAAHVVGSLTASLARLRTIRDRNCGSRSACRRVTKVGINSAGGCHAGEPASAIRTVRRVA